MALTDDAHALVRDHFHNRATTLAVDATCGNGHDAEFLAQLGFDKVVVFDVQQYALDVTRQRLNPALLQKLELHLAGHETMLEVISGPIDCAMFNFGYLPSGDKNKTTQADTSVQALEAATTLLDVNGIITLICYPGHSPGASETLAIQQWLKQLSSEWNYTTHMPASPKPTAPIMYSLTKTLN